MDKDSVVGHVWGQLYICVSRTNTEIRWPTAILTDRAASRFEIMPRHNLASFNSSFADMVSFAATRISSRL